MLRESLTRPQSEALNHIIREWKPGNVISALDKMPQPVFSALRVELDKHSNALRNGDGPAKICAEIAVIELLRRVETMD